MLKVLDKYQAESYALLRIVTGFMFALHGLQKTFGLLGGTRHELASQMGVGGLIELLAGLAVMVGFSTRLAAFLASGQMAVAYVQFHWKFQLGEQFLPVVNRGELAALYSFVFLLIATRGAGTWSVDARA